MRITHLHTLTAGLALVLATAACGSDSSSDDDAGAPETTAASTDTTTGTSTGTDAAGTAGYLTSVCPATIKIQLGWYPQPDPYAMVYGLLAPDGELDSEAASYTSSALADPDQKIEVIGGGPLVGYQQVSALLYTDSDILLGDVALDEAIAQSKTFPTVGVLAPFEKSPLGLMYNPDAVTLDSLEDVKESGTTVLAAAGQTSIAALVGLGKLDESQVDSSYTYSPAQFVAADGDIAQQAFATQEPYTYENAPFWGKATGVLLLADQGYPNYQNAMVVTPENLEANGACLERLVPLMQQSMVDYFASPDATDTLIADLSDQLKNPTPVTVESEQFAHDVMSEDGLVANSAGTSTFGLFDSTRVQDVIDVVSPVFEGSANFDPEVDPEALFTNDFLDPAIGFAQ
ncbi:nitrate ABC transporter substrate-binding protein [soil metagenome]